MREMIKKYGEDALISMTDTAFSDRCQKLRTGRGMGDLVDQWVKMYKPY